jgi:hypothetical protein
MNKVQYLGYIVDEHGVHVDPYNIQFICDWPASITLTKLRRFSHIAWALNQVTKGSGTTKFVWGKENQRAFKDMKHHLCSSSLLSLLDLQQPFEIETDASDYAVGTILTQYGHPVAYHSETVSNTFLKYPMYDKEMYSIV